MGLFRRGRDRPSAPYASVAGWNELPSVTARRERAQHGRPRRRERPANPEGARPRPPRTRAQRVRRLLLALFLIFVAVPSLLMVLAYWSADIPDPAAVQTEQVATITAVDGTTEIAKVVPPEGNRTPVPLSDVPRWMRDAMLSAEDRDFYRNPGFSTEAFVRAARDNLTGRENAGGGSTITQQYVKNAFLSSERTLSRKMRELIISAKMARQWSKDDILAAYLNTIYYGRGAYGIAAAAEAYFDKPVPQLTLAESAVLAAVVRTPSILDPETHLEQLRARWNYVLDGMVTMGTLAPEQRATVEFPVIAPVAVLTDDSARRPAGLIRTQVLRELRAAGISEQDIATGALNIVTTIDPRAQQAALDAVHRTLSGQPPELRGAVVSIDPRSGAVRAYYGGENGVGFDFAQAPLQTGSAFKTFAVLAALEQGIGMSYQLDSSPVTVNGVKVTNVEGESCGTCSLAEAFKRSLNTSFYRLAQGVGAQSIANAAHQAGIPERIPGVPGRSLSEQDGTPQLSIVLGVYSVRPIDMASAYATIAASGVYHEPYFVQRVVAGDGRVLLDRGAPEQRPAEQRIARRVADTTAQAMLPIPAYSNGHALAGRPSAAKTGTTQLGETGANKDAWMIGFTPSLSTAVWVGTENPQPIRTARGTAVYGAGLPADIWKRTMDGALAGTPVEQFPASEQPAAPETKGVGPFGVAPPTPQSAQGPFDVLAPPANQAPPPILEIPPPPTRQVEIFPGLSIPVPG
ncbi:penicillin-binding protein [Nocardia sp. CDC159]|uniref:Penicillin-binding protein n=1 Tax=Nocardia pulmonis TaxID=2951408 RepID=A0A9X2J1Z9_9NOCA|nr:MULTISPECIES: transglycosylase domain-containing protein [Nocardia]MCM6777521.1 penicillin-binding protein [Nocardia pulmonis]MCM6790372.1 penicillin-binding protein [Nocardia sp. CDC159]